MRISLTHRRKISLGLGALALAATATTAATLPALASARTAAPRGDVIVNCTGRAQGALPFRNAACRSR